MSQSRSAAVASAPSAPPPLTAEEAVPWAVQQAETEGLTLLKSESSRTGYKGVTVNSSLRKGVTYVPHEHPYQAKVWRRGKMVHLGQFATAEEAALCHARSPEGQAAAMAAAAAPPEPPPMTAEEVLQLVLQQAEAEGLTLLRSENSSTGYKGVTFKGSRTLTKPYQAEVKRGGKLVYLGYFVTAEEAALCYARTSAAQAAAQQPPAASSRSTSRKRKVRSEQQPPDEPADVVVILEGRIVESATFE